MGRRPIDKVSHVYRLRRVHRAQRLDEAVHLHVRVVVHQHKPLKRTARKRVGVPCGGVRQRWQKARLRSHRRHDVVSAPEWLCRARGIGNGHFVAPLPRAAAPAVVHTHHVFARRHQRDPLRWRAIRSRAVPVGVSHAHEAWLRATTKGSVLRQHPKPRHLQHEHEEHGSVEAERRQDGSERRQRDGGPASVLRRMQVLAHPTSTARSREGGLVHLLVDQEVTEIMQD
eukprot:6797463-Prymnesium_polylepis.1